MESFGGPYAKAIAGQIPGGKYPAAAEGGGPYQPQLVAKIQLAGGTIGDATTLAKIEAGVRNIRVTDLAAMQKIFSCAYEEFFQGL